MSPESRNTEEQAEWPGAGALAGTRTTSCEDIQPAKPQLADSWAGEGPRLGPEAPYLKSPSTTGGEFASHFPTTSLIQCLYAPSPSGSPDGYPDTRPEGRPTRTPELSKGEWALHSTSARLSVSERPAVALPGPSSGWTQGFRMSCQDVKSSISESNWQLKTLAP